MLQRPSIILAWRRAKARTRFRRWCALPYRPGLRQPRPTAHLVALHNAGEHTTGELGDVFSVARSTV